MLKFIFRKILNNKWMMLCLAIGAIFTTAMISSIPIYTQGMLQRMLIKDLEGYQKESDKFPGNFNIGIAFYEYLFKGEKLISSYKTLNDNVSQMADEYKLPYLAYTHEIAVNESFLKLQKLSGTGPDEIKVNIKAMKDMEQHIKILHGRMFSSRKSEGAYEILVSESAFNNLGLQMDEVYDVKLQGRRGYIKIKVAGIFGISSKTDPYWPTGIKEYDESVFIDFELLNLDFENQIIPVSNASWNYAFDYHSIRINDVEKLLELFENQQSRLGRFSNSIKPEMSAIPLLKQYLERQKQLKTVLWVLIVPVLLVLILYIFMASRMIIKSEENEIAVLKSRGVSGSNIFAGYVVQSLILGGTAFLAGPPAGLFLCGIIGASDGFLEFVRRSALPVSINISSYLYALIAFILFSVTMSIPAYLASKTTIVLHKQKKSRSSEKALWAKYYIDIVILFLSMYGLYRYYSRQKVLAATGIKAVELDMDPLLFLITTFFVLGVGMLFLRCFPYIIGMIYRIGRLYWPPVLYVTFIQVGRAQGREQFLMLFMILSLAMGIFSANSARTINKNIEDKINYHTGSDITLKARWDIVHESTRADEKTVSSQTGTSGYLKSNEPPFRQFQEIKGADTVTKVFIEEEAKARVGSKSINHVQIIGITPDEFGKAVNFRDGLLPHHINQYLNLISGAPKAFLVSSNIRDKHRAKAGDPISVAYLRNGQAYTFDGVIYGFVDYWPAFNPVSAEAGKEAPSLVVGNLAYIQQATRIEPYQVWIKKKNGITDDEIFKDISSKNLDLEKITSAKQLLIRKKNDPMLQGINGILTLSFIMTMAICMIGFLIFWILSIKGRVLQFGVFRAMGLTLKSVLLMIVYEQLLISGTSILAGIVIGGAASDLFIPLLQLIYSAAEQVPPFKVTASGVDYIKIYIIISVMLLIGFTVLRAIVKGISINQAIKLGEE